MKLSIVSKYELDPFITLASLNGKQNLVSIKFEFVKLAKLEKNGQIGDEILNFEKSAFFCVKVSGKIASGISCVSVWTVFAPLASKLNYWRNEKFSTFFSKPKVFDIITTFLDW